MDVLPALAVATLVSAIAIPVVAGTLERERTLLAAQYLAARLAEARVESLRRGTAVALRVEEIEHDIGLQLFADGNGNGVLRSDIDAGIDVPIGAAERLGVRARGVSLRINQRVPDPGGSGWLEAGSDPIRIGRASLVSCTPTGSLTSGTLYVAAMRGPQMAVRITGTSGRIRVLRYEPVRGLWTT